MYGVDLQAAVSRLLLANGRTWPDSAADVETSNRRMLFFNIATRLEYSSHDSQEGCDSGHGAVGIDRCSFSVVIEPGNYASGSDH